MEREYFVQIVKKLEEIKEKIKPSDVKVETKEVNLEEIKAPLVEILQELKKKDEDEEEVYIEITDELREKLKGKDAVVDYEKVISDVTQKVLDDIKIPEVDLSAIHLQIKELSNFITKVEFKHFKEKVQSEFEKLPEELKQKLLEDEDFIDRLHKKIPERQTYSGGGRGVKRLDQLIDVDVSELEKDENGRYVLGGGGTEFFIADNRERTNDFVYRGGINADDQYQINRQSVATGLHAGSALGDWADRTTLTYT